MYPDNLSAANTVHTYEIIDLDQSDDEEQSDNKHECMPDVSAFLAPMSDLSNDSPQDETTQQDDVLSYNDIKMMTNFKNECSEEEQEEEEENSRDEPMDSKATIFVSKKLQRNGEKSNDSADSPQSYVPASSSSYRTSPLLASIKPLHTNGEEYNAAAVGSTDGHSELTLQGFSLPASAAATLFSPKKHRAGNTSPSTDKQSSKRKSIANGSNTDTNDHIELYCLSLVDCLRAMPRSERERVKFEFAKILKDAQYKDQL